MNRHINSADRTRRLASLALGSLAVLALAASPAMAHAKLVTSDTVRHTMLVAELTGADASEAADLEAMLDIEDGDGQVDSVDQADQQDSQGDQAETSNDSQTEVDTEDTQDDSSDTSGDSSETETHDGGHSGSDGGNDGGGD